MRAIGELQRQVCPRRTERGFRSGLAARIVCGELPWEPRRHDQVVVAGATPANCGATVMPRRPLEPILDRWNITRDRRPLAAYGGEDEQTASTGSRTICR